MLWGLIVAASLAIGLCDTCEDLLIPRFLIRAITMLKVEKALVRNFMQILAFRSKRMVEPSLVPIYLRPDGLDSKTRQIGTGFLIALNGNCILISARHVLFGHRYDEDPSTRHVVFKSRLRGLSELKSGEIFLNDNNDLAAICVNEFGVNRCLPTSCLLPAEATCSLIAIHGFLARDFHREIRTGALRPRPNLYTNRRFVLWSRIHGNFVSQKQEQGHKHGGKSPRSTP